MLYEGVVFKETEKLVNSLLPPDKQVKVEELWKSIDEKRMAEAQKVLKEHGINITIDDVKPEHVDKAKEFFKKAHLFGW